MAGAGAGPYGSLFLPGSSGPTVRRSARLMSKAEIQAILSATNPSDADLIDATLSDAVIAAEAADVGSKRKRGSGKRKSYVGGEDGEGGPATKRGRKTPASAPSGEGASSSGEGMQVDPASVPGSATAAPAPSGEGMQVDVPPSPTPTGSAASPSLPPSITQEGINAIVTAIDNVSPNPSALGQALKNTGSALAGMTRGAIGVVDRAAAAAVGLIPGAVKAAAVGAGTTFLINNPTLLAQIVGLINRNLSAVITANTGATWDTYQYAINELANQVGGVFATVRDQGPNSPWFVITTALLIMKFRAGRQGIGLRQLIANDAKSIGSAIKDATIRVGEAIYSAALGQYSAFLKAYAAGAVERSAKQIRDLGRRVEITQGKGAEAMSMASKTGAPSAQMSPFEEEGIALVPAKGGPVFTRALKAIENKEPESSDVLAAAAALAAMAKGGPTSAPEGSAGAGSGAAPMDTSLDGGRRRGKGKTKKRAPKRRTTRRKPRMALQPVRFAY